MRNALDARHDRARAVAERAGVQLWVDVQSEDRRHLGIGEHVFLDHLPGTAGLPLGHAFFSRLEDQLDRAGQPVAQLHEYPGHPQQHGRM